jgi:alpha-galactosidase/6-phospho-beta-glucosidase family protein
VELAPRIVIIGGGSYQWVPKLLVDIANTHSLHQAEIVLCDIDPEPLPRMVELVEHISAVRGIPLTGSSTTEQRAALDGADYVVVSISTGGFESMRHDLEIPARYGIRQSVGDTVGPGGIVRALRNVPVLLGIAHDMQECCPAAWMLNLTNPMTALCRAVTKATSVPTVGLCHEVTIAQFVFSLMLDESFLSIRPTVAGVNHLPLVTDLDVDGDDGLERLRKLIADADRIAEEPLAMPFPEGLGHEKISEGPDWTKGDLLATNRVKLTLFERFGVLPGAGDRHLVEFFPGFLTEESGWGARWGVHLTSIEDRERWQRRHVDDFERMLAASAVSEVPSGEMVASTIDSLLTGRTRMLPLNIPNTGQVADLPTGVVTESICVVDDKGVRGGEPVAVPPVLSDFLASVSSAQELTVEAALTGDRDKVFAAMFVDPLAGRTDFDRLAAMTDEMLAATSQWLPQFA